MCAAVHGTCLMKYRLKVAFTIVFARNGGPNRFMYGISHTFHSASRIRVASDIREKMNVRDAIKSPSCTCLAT